MSPKTGRRCQFQGVDPCRGGGKSASPAGRGDRLPDSPGGGPDSAERGRVAGRGDGGVPGSPADLPGREEGRGRRKVGTGYRTTIPKTTPSPPGFARGEGRGEGGKQSLHKAEPPHPRPLSPPKQGERGEPITPSPPGFAGGEGRGEGGNALAESRTPSPPTPLPPKAGGEGRMRVASFGMLFRRRSSSQTRGVG